MLLLALCLCGMGQEYARQLSRNHVLATRTYEHVYAVPPPAALWWLSLGHREAMADLLWVRSLIYLGEDTAERQPSNDIFAYADAIVRLDPHFSAAYRIPATATLSAPGLSGRALRQRAHDAVALLERGVRALPDDGELSWDLGSIYAYTIAPMAENDDEFFEAKRRGLEHMRTAVLKGFGPPWAGLANASTLLRLGQTQQAIDHLEELYALVDAPEIKAEIEARLRHLKASAFVEGMRAAVDDLRRRHQKRMPYADEALFLLTYPSASGDETVTVPGEVSP